MRTMPTFELGCKCEDEHETLFVREVGFCSNCGNTPYCYVQGPMVEWVALMVGDREPHLAFLSQVPLEVKHPSKV